MCVCSWFYDKQVKPQNIALQTRLYMLHNYILEADRCILIWTCMFCFRFGSKNRHTVSKKPTHFFQSPIVWAHPTQHHEHLHWIFECDCVMLSIYLDCIQHFYHLIDLLLRICFIVLRVDVQSMFGYIRKLHINSLLLLTQISAPRLFLGSAGWLTVHCPGWSKLTQRYCVTQKIPIFSYNNHLFD